MGADGRICTTANYNNTDLTGDPNQEEFWNGF
jgi:hypothetical protein